MKAVYYLGLPLIIVILLLCLIKYRNEGFNMNDDAHAEYSKKYQKKYNRVGAALVASKNENALGQETGGLFGNIEDVMDASNHPVQKVTNPYPLEGGKSGMFDTIDKCEAVKTTSCSAFDDPKFSKDCGLCLDIGTNSQNKPSSGGLVLTSRDKEYGKSQQRGYSLAPYEPTVGTCPAGRMVATKAECLRLEKELNCQKRTVFNSPTGCSQCFSDTAYHVVDPAYDPELLKGSGSIMVIGSGKLFFSESGQNNSGTQVLSTIPYKITLFGPEFNTLSLNVKSPPVPIPYENGNIYAVDALVIFNNTIYKMVEGAGAPGYAPNRPGDRLWQMVGPYDTYTPPPPTFIAGYLTGKTANGDFNIDLYRIILSDAETGRKPRTMDSVSIDDIDCTNMGPGFGKKDLSLTARSPFTFTDPFSQEASLCPSSPYITKEASSNFLESDPCYKKGSGPGKYSIECLQNIFLNNGCTDKGNGYPTNAAKSSSLLYDPNGNALKIDQIADMVYRSAVTAATGIDARGNQVAIIPWSERSVFCTGKAINSPCDANSASGPLLSDCIVYLWDNQGENKIPGSTYSMGSFARSLFSSGRTQQYCSRKGSLSPKDLSGKVNDENMNYWKKIGGVAAVKAAMAQLHLNANSTIVSEDIKTPFIKQCYGIVPDSRPLLKSSFKSDTSVLSNSNKAPQPASTGNTSTLTGPGRSF